MTVPVGASHSSWYKTAFDPLYLTLYNHRDRDDARRAVDFLRERIGLVGVTSLLDLCCGAGRHLVELREAGIEAVGLDLSAGLLERAKADLERTAARRLLVQGEMEALPFRPGFDLTINLFTSFGYFESDETNGQVFREVARTLRPGGRFVIDFLNAPKVRASLVPYTREEEPDGLVVESRRSIEGSPPRVVKRIRVAGRWSKREIVESVRLFERHELEALLERAGMRMIGAWGDFDGRTHDDGSPRCILAAKKKP